MYGNDLEDFFAPQPRQKSILARFRARLTTWFKRLRP